MVVKGILFIFVAGNIKGVRQEATLIMVEEFLNYLQFELRRSPRTVDDYRTDLGCFEAFFKGLGDEFGWDTVDSDVIRDWMESMIDKGNKAATVCRRLSAVRSFYRFALAHRLVEYDPAHKIEPPKKSKPLPQFLKEDEINKLLDGDMWGDDYKDVRARTIIMTFYETGVRLSELTGLNEESVDFAESQLKVTGKGNKQRIIPFGKELSEGLKYYLSVRNKEVNRLDDAFFLTEKGVRMTSQQVRGEVKKHLSRVCTLKKLSPHVLRHTFATAMLNHGAGIESVKRLLGHESVSTTEIYTHTTFEQLKRIYNEAHPRA